MVNDRRYKRYFIILENEDSGFEKNDKKIPKGYAKIEVRNGKGLLNVYVQDLKYFKDAKYIYRNYLISTKGQKGLFVNIGTFMIDEKGKGELKTKFNPDNVEKSGRCIEDFDVVAVIAEPIERSSLGKEVFGPLVGYMDKDREKVNWKDAIVYEQSEIKKDDEIDNEYKKKYEEIINVIENSSKELYQEKDSSANKEKNQKSKNKEDNNLNNKKKIQPEKKEEKAEKKEEIKPEEKEEVKPDKKEEVKPKQKEEIKPEKKEKISPKKEEKIKSEEKEKVKPDKKEEVKPKQKEEMKPQKKEKVSPKKEEKIKPEEKVKEDKKEEAKPKQKEKMKPEKKEKVSPDKKEESKKSKYYFGKNKDIHYKKYHKMVYKYVKDMLKYYEKVDPFEKNIDGYKWWKMDYDKKIMHRAFLPFFGYILNIYYYNPYLYYRNNCQNLMSKYGHYAFGIAYDEDMEPKYYVYGVPGKYLYNDQPFQGMTGFVTWHPLEDKEPEKGDYGYWLLHIDAMTGNVIFPMKPTTPPMY